jgi:heat shock protein HtpX
VIHSLPADTVFEAKRRTRRASALLLAQLLFVYVVFINVTLLIPIVYFTYGSRIFLGIESITVEVGERPVTFTMAMSYGILISTAIGVLFGLFHYLSAWSRKIDSVLFVLNAKRTDKNDELHEVYVNIVHEAETATGIASIRPVVIASAGANAFAVKDRYGNCAIGVTEGLLERLDRSELTAVVSHEAAHLLNDDARINMIVCSIYRTFEKLVEIFASSPSDKYERHGRGSAIPFFMGFAAQLGLLVSKMIGMAVSRNRELLADALAVQMCKDPLSLAEALQKISGHYRGSGEVASGYSSAFIVNPRFDSIDESSGWFAGLFSSHPPLAKRLKSLLDWARVDVGQLIDKQIADQGNLHAELRRKKDKVEAEANTEARTEDVPRLLAHKEDKWEGPFTPDQLLAFAWFNPSTWVVEQGRSDVVHASDQPLLQALFRQQGLDGGGGALEDCPRCKVSMRQEHYEGAPVLHCRHCDGYLLDNVVLSRILARKIEQFSTEEINAAVGYQLKLRGAPKEICGLPMVKCPTCGKDMLKTFHPLSGKIVIDRCLDESCGKVWCDPGELELIQMVAEYSCRRLNL